MVGVPARRLLCGPAHCAADSAGPETGIPTPPNYARQTPVLSPVLGLRTSADPGFLARGDLICRALLAYRTLL